MSANLVTLHSSPKNGKKPLDIDENRLKHIFIDWLSMYQEHVVNKPLPKVSGSLIVKTDEHGELIYDIVGYKDHAGSFDTNINVKCDGFRVEISGNPSRYNRLDNVFGYTSLNTCIELYNQILNKFGLPPLDIGRAQIKRVDITENHAVGRKNPEKHIRMLSSCCYNGELGYLYPNGQTCDWFKHSRRLYLKVYNKAFELKKHLKKCDKISGVTAREIKYIRDLIIQCERVGIVRVELELSRQILSELNLSTLKKREIMGDLIELFEKKNPYLQKSNYGNVSNSDEVFEIAIDKEYTVRQANNIKDYYDLWVTGADFKVRYPKKSTYYRICSLLKSVGVDVRKPMDITRLQHVMIPLEYKRLLPSDAYEEFVPCLKSVCNF